MKNLKILLIGQPNVGKSSLLNALAGHKSLVSNYPGTTVEITRAERVFNGVRIDLLDTPGIYSISDRSKEEKVTEEILFEGEVDGAIVIADATALERSLYMALQILESHIPVILALNFMEQAQKAGIKIDYEKLQIFLNIKVIPINPITRKGLVDLMDAVINIHKKPTSEFDVQYDDHIEFAIGKISRQVEGRLPARFVALRALEEDDDFYKYLANKEVIKEVKDILAHDHPKVLEDICIMRYGTASFIAGKVTEITSLKKRKTFEERIDRIFLHEKMGPLITALFIIVIFGTLLYLGNFSQDFLMSQTERLLSYFHFAGKSVFSLVIFQGITGVAAGVSIALPYVFLFYLILGLLEDIGVLSRFIVNAERFLKKLGLPGKSFIPLALGLGCTVPATRATRILSSSSDSIYTTALLAFVPCSSRIAIIMGIVGFYGGVKLTFSVLVSILIAALIWTFAMKIIFNIKSEPLLLELPPYRKPILQNLIAKSWIRMKDFVYVVIPLLALGGMTYSILDISGLTDNIVKPLSPISNWLGLPDVTVIPLVFGFLQKDLTGSMLVSVLGVNISFMLTPLQIYSFGLATTIGIPCIIASGMLMKEFGFKKSALLTFASIIYGILFAGISWRIISIFA
ncbi:ferrous iron transport protein B [Candidatus Sumerlaeota bacterium]|nr:ferrous iron transport protein B [Candidatus Sumerlaeota bacterium]